MGAWGTGIFQDDTACDVRDEYRDHIGNGLSAEEATARILKNYASSLADPGEAGVVWLALAATQWKLGRLDNDTLQHALYVIDSGSDLERWGNAGKDHAARKAALEKLRTQITSAQPLPRKIEKRVLCECNWKSGELVALRLLSGKLTVFRVIGHHTDRGGTYPVCELLDWSGDAIPSAEVLQMTGVKQSRPDYKHTITQLMIVGIKKKAAARLEELGISLKPAQKRGASSVVHWKYLDKFLKEWFLLE
jgi:hypothetical protein